MIEVVLTFRWPKGSYEFVNLYDEVAEEFLALVKLRDDTGDNTELMQYINEVGSDMNGWQTVDWDEYN